MDLEPGHLRLRHLGVQGGVRTSCRSSSRTSTGAKQLIQQAGATGKTLTIGTSSQLADISRGAGAYQAAAQAIGLKVKLKSVSANNYINFFIDPKARAGIDGFLTVNYGDYADPAALLSDARAAEGSQNYDGYDNPQITELMDQARSTADPNARRSADRQGGEDPGDHRPALDPERPADVAAADEQEPERGDRLVRVHVRAVGRDQLGGKGKARAAAVLPAPAADARGQPCSCRAS